jgi:hypothetical protein
MQTPADMCAKYSILMRKFEELLCGVKDAIIDEVLLGTAADNCRMHDGVPLL